ncbi:MAG: hypothetical protein OXU86_07070 [Thaumarchaeota archaeon]|nr:hypothetical protein [Nitrososphaerota archaeon]MDD9826511.1 hypothetical protein [Nitrososphaerota archaeon]
MRLGGAADGPFMGRLGAEADAAREAYARLMAACTRPARASVMLGDGTVREEETFDPAAAEEAMGGVARGLDGWDVRAPDTTRNDDKRRLFTKFSVEEEGHRVSGHLSLQYHVLLYYEPDQRVMDCQRRLSEVIGQAGGADERRAARGDEVARRMLAEAGVEASGEQEIFEALYNDAGLRARIAAAVDAADEGARNLRAERASLLAELDSRLLEVYRTSHVLIDEARLVGGEEGYLFSLDVERAGGGLDPGAMPAAAREAVARRVAQARAALEAEAGRRA